MDLRVKIRRTLFSPGTTLGQRVARAGIWVFALRVVDRGFKFTRIFILARVLAPSDFGLFGVASLALSALESFSRTGFNEALIQRKENTETYLNTAWTTEILRATVVAALLALSAPFVAAFFEEPRTIALMRVLAIGIFLRGFENVGIIYFKKDLNFRKQFLYDAGGSLVDLIVAVSMALIFRNVWALILGVVAGNLTRLVLSYLIHSYRPSFNFELDKIRELFGFGRWVTATNVLVFLSNEGDDILLGKLLGTTALGFYQMAYRISNLPATEIANVISEVSFPAYSSLQDFPKRLEDAFLKVFQATMAAAVPVTMAIVYFSGPFVSHVLGSQWAPIIGPIRILAVWGFIRAVSKSLGILCKASGRPALNAYTSLIRVLAIMAAIVPLSNRFGIEGTALSVIAGSLIAITFQLYVAARAFGITPIKLLRESAGPGVVTLMTLAVLFKLDAGLMNSDSSIVALMVRAIIGALIYVGIAFSVERFSRLRVSPLVQFKRLS